jgi:hypothetical protein
MYRAMRLPCTRYCANLGSERRTFLDLIESVELVEGGTTSSPATEPSAAPSWEAECNCPETCNRDHEQD